ncbi:MAG: TVP38/TMEM64 family protein [Candidatus Methylomirabilales bacterium]
MPLKPSVVLKGTLVVALAGGLVASPTLRDFSSSLSPDRIQAWLNEAGSLAPILFVAMVATAIVVSPIPSLPLDVAAGAFFGPLLGTVYAVIGALLGAVASFWIARLLGRELIEQILGGHINFCTVCSDRLLTRIVFLSRLLPVISFDMVSYGAGLTKMSTTKFALATGVGMIPLTFVYTYFGSAVAFGSGVTLVMGAVTVTLFFLIPRWIEKHDLFSLRRYFQHGEGE